MSAPAVIVKNVTKTFKIPLEASTGAKQKIINALKGIKGYRNFSPLNDVSFEIKEGDFFGIVGRNGSGKSTLLKTIAGIYTPNGGSVQVAGKLVPFIELGVGFNPQLSGRENVFLNGALLGFSQAEMQAMYDDIVDFAELHDFMEERLKNYSSGMQVRLAFSIAIRAQGDILLLDEVLAVGDEAFQKKCFRYFQSLKNNKKTVILVTHDMNAVREYCNKALLLDQGKVVAMGSADEIATAYSDLFNPRTHGNIPEARWGTQEIMFKEVQIDEALTTESQVAFRITIEEKRPIQGALTFAFAFRDARKQNLAGDDFTIDSTDLQRGNGQAEYLLTFSNLFNKGNYFLDISVRPKGTEAYYDVWMECAEVTLSHGNVSSHPVRIKSTLQERK